MFSIIAYTLSTYYTRLDSHILYMYVTESK